MLVPPKKNRNIKGLQITEAAAKPGTLARPSALKPSTSSTSSLSVPTDTGSANSSPLLPISARSSTSSYSGSTAYHNKLTEQIANLEIGIEFKVDLRAEDLEVIDELGCGNGGTVSRVKHLPTSATMARKVVHIDAKPAVRKQILRELQIMHDCNSPYIVSFYGAYIADPHICMCMEYMDKGSLDNIYKKIGPIKEPYLGQIALAMVCGLNYLYEVHRILHRDVKPSNVLLNSAGQIKICDFGVSGELVNSIADTFVGTSTYMSPERIQGAQYTVKSDVWSLGITLIELALGRFPFSNDDDADDECYSDEELTLSPVRPGAKDLTIAAAEAKKQKALEHRKQRKKEREGVSLGGIGGQMSILELLQHVVNEPAPTLPAGKYPKEADLFVDSCLTKEFDTRPTPKDLLRYKWLVDATNTTVDLEAWAKTIP